MNSKKIYLIRHGQTDFNRMGIVQGSGVNTSLNAFGREQAKAFYETYKHIPFDKVYTSTLNRSIESVQHFLENNIPHEHFSGLNEINWGRKEGQKITPEEDEYYHFMLDQWRKGNTALRIEGGESPEDVVTRLKPVVAHIFKQVHEKTILICMHGRAMRMLLCYLTKQPLSSMDLFEHENLCLYELNCIEDTCTIEKNNNVDHLRDLS